MALGIQRQIWQYKVKRDKRVEKTAMILTKVKVPAVLGLEMTSA